MKLYTIGHSNVSADAFAEKLRAWGVELLVDVRRYPSSRRHPHFNRPALAADLEGRGIAYLHEERLGGHREPVAGSPHTALDGGFRGYADYMGTPAFRQAVERLVTLAGERVTAVMCAEADPARCHRRYLSDALVARGIDVVHLLSATESRPHEMHTAARVAEGALVYPDPRPRQMELFGTAS